MKLLKSDGLTYLDIEVVRYEPTIEINYELVSTASSLIRSVDRGSGTDKYICTFTIKNRKDKIDEVIEEINLLRLQNKKFIFSECEENYFGYNVDHSNGIEALLLSKGERKSTSFNIYSIEFTFIADVNKLDFEGYTSFPLKLCLQNSYTGTYNYNHFVTQTYYGENFHVNTAQDNASFDGTFICNEEDTKRILNFHRLNRGNVFSFDENIIDISNMFGPESLDTIHDVIIQSVTYERLSPILFSVKIKLIKQ